MMQRRDFLKAVPVLAVAPLAIGSIADNKHKQQCSPMLIDEGAIQWEADYWNNTQMFIKGKLRSGGDPVTMRFKHISFAENVRKNCHCMDIIRSILIQRQVSLRLCTASFEGECDAWIRCPEFFGGEWMMVMLPPDTGEHK